MRRVKPTLAYLMHMTHYDPHWVEHKATEKPFDPSVAQAVIEALRGYGFNALVVSVGDGVVFRSHPELRKHYSEPMKILVALAKQARAAGMEFIPKFNFSMSAINCHNDWIRAPKQTWWDDLDHDAAYYGKAFAIIDEVVKACGGATRLHIGMDEDHNRSHAQFVATIEALRKRLKQRGLRTIMWSDAAIPYPNGQVYVEKALAALEHCSRDVVQVLWDYRGTPTRAAKRIVDNGFEWLGAPGWSDAKQISNYANLCRRLGATGLLMTRWIKCVKENRQELLDCIHRAAPHYRL